MTGLINAALWTPHNRQVNATKNFGAADDLAAILARALGQDAGGDMSARRLYDDVPFIRACVNIRAQALASVPFVIEGARGTVLFDSDDASTMPDALAYLSGLPMLLRRLATSLALESRAYLYKEARRRTFERLAWINPVTMRIDPEHDVDSRGVVVSYTREVSGGTVRRIPRDELVVFEVPGVYSEYGWTRSDTYSARESAGALYEYSRFSHGHIAAGLIKAILFSVADPSKRGRKPGEAEELRLKDVLRRWLRERKASEKDPLIVSELLNVQEFGEGLAGLSNEALTEFLRQDIAAALGVPYSLLTSSAANFATMQLDTLGLYTHTVFPDMELIQAALNADVLRPGGYVLQFRPERLEAVQFVQDQQADAVLKLRTSDVITRREARVRIGEEPDPAPDMVDDAPPPQGDGVPPEARSLPEWRVGF